MLHPQQVGSKSKNLKVGYSSNVQMPEKCTQAQKQNIFTLLLLSPIPWESMVCANGFEFFPSVSFKPFKLSFSQQKHKKLWRMSAHLRKKNMSSLPLSVEQQELEKIVDLLSHPLFTNWASECGCKNLVFSIFLRCSRDLGVPAGPTRGAAWLFALCTSFSRLCSARIGKRKKERKTLLLYLFIYSFILPLPPPPAGASTCPLEAPPPACTLFLLICQLCQRRRGGGGGGGSVGLTGVIISVIAATVAAAQPAVCQGVGSRSSGISTAAFSQAENK